MPEGTSAPPAHAPPRPALAWCVVAGIVGLLLLLHALHPDPGAEEFALEQMTQQVQAQYGTREIAGPFAGPDTFEAMEKLHGRGPVAQRQRFAVVAADLRGPAKGLAHLDATEKLLRERGTPLAGRAREVEAILRRKFTGGTLSKEEQVALRGELGWFGDLALAPAGGPGREQVMEPARRVAKIQVLLAAGCLALLGLGVVAAAVFWLAVLRREGTFFLLGPGTAPHGLYAETFAAWMVLFVLVSLLADLAGGGLALEGCAILCTLSALAWPVWRGVPFARVRDDLGLRMPANPVKEILAGIACWVSSIPVMAAALVVVVALAYATGMVGGDDDPLAPTRMPTHPIMGEMAHNGRWFLILALASGVAPLVEETFFRGALYRHLRDATGRRGRLVSVAMAAGISGFVFAVIHPQGIVAVPLLMAVAWSLVQAREWRGSLLAPMAAHAVNNAAATLFAWIALGGR